MNDERIVTTYCYLTKARKGYLLSCQYGEGMVKPNTDITRIQDIEPFMISYLTKYGYTIVSTVRSANMETITIHAI